MNTYMNLILEQRFFRLLSEYSQRKVSASEFTEAIEELATHPGWVRVGVLTQDDNLDLVGRRVGEGIEDVVLCWVDSLLGTQKGDALEQLVRSVTYRLRCIAQPSCYVAVAGRGVHGAPLRQMLCWHLL